MAMTLAEMKVGMSDKVAEQVVDTFPARIRDFAVVTI